MVNFEVIASDLGFVEGPVWTGERVLVTSITAGVIHELALDGSHVGVYASPGGGPNGLARTTDALWAAQGGTGHFGLSYTSERPPGLLRITRDGAVTYAVSAGVTAPSDCAVGPGGRLWFTDPQTSLETPTPGQVLVYDTVEGTLVKATKDEHYPSGFYPNGIAFGLDSTTLYVADTKNHRVLQYHVTAQHLSEPSTFAECHGYPDGLAVDAQGNVYVALLMADRISVYSPSGEPLHAIEIPGSRPTNLCFGGEGLTRMIVTASKGGRVLLGDAPVPGLALTSA